MTARTRKIISIGAAVVIPAAIFVLWTDFWSSVAIREQLKSLSPWMLEMNFGLLLVGLVLNWESIWKPLRDAARPLRLCLGALMLASSALVFFAAPRIHRIFYDEDIYLNIGQNIAVLGKAGMCDEGAVAHGTYRCFQLEYNKEPNAWPFLLGTVFRVFGTHEISGFLLNNFLFLAGILVVFLIGSHLFTEPWTALYGAVLYAFTPVNALWFSTAAAEPGAAVFAAFAVLALLIFLRSPRTVNLFLLAAALPFAAQFRPESFLIYFVAVLAVALWRPAQWEALPVPALAFLSLMLLLPHLLHLYAVRAEHWGSSGPKFALDYLLTNGGTNGFFYLQNEKFLFREFKERENTAADLVRRVFRNLPGVLRRQLRIRNRRALLAGVLRAARASRRLGGALFGAAAVPLLPILARRARKPADLPDAYFPAVPAVGARRNRRSLAGQGGSSLCRASRRGASRGFHRPDS